MPHYFAHIDLWELCRQQALALRQPPVTGESVEGAAAEGSEERTAPEPSFTVPETLQIPLLPEGKFAHPFYGDLEWTPEKFKQTQANFENRVTGYQPMLNFDHAAQNPFAAAAPAAGWIQSVLPVPGSGLFAQVDLTPKGRQAIADREYRYISAEFADEYCDSRGQEFANVLVGAALTNLPFHDTMPGLFGQAQAHVACFSTQGPASFWAAQGGQRMNIRKLLGLPENAPKEAVAEAASKAAEPEAQAAETPTAQAAAPAAVQVAADAATVTLNRADLDKMLAAAAQVETLAKRVETAEKAQADAQQALAKKQAEDRVQLALSQGKIAPVQQAEALAFALENPARFDSLYAAAPALVQYTPRGLPASYGEAATATESYEAMVEQVMAQRPGMDYADAANYVASENPQAYDTYRRQVTKGGR